MSPLRFRAFDKEHGDMLSHYDLDRSDTEGLIMWGQIFAGKEPDIVLMQSTGLHGKNGKEIYEGDIIRFGLGENFTQEFEVFWDDEIASFGMRPEGNYIHTGIQQDRVRRGEVIGNIYENPELLPPAA